MICILVISILVISIYFSGYICGIKSESQKILRMKICSDKYLYQLKLAVKWIKDTSKIITYLSDYKNKKICIYGMSYFGDCLVELLRSNNFEVMFGIDRNAKQLFNKYIPIYDLNCHINEVDVIIVTAVECYPEIKDMLSKKVERNIEIVSLEDILYS